MSVGGVLGGLFNAVFAPLLFDNVLEYPLVVMVAALLRPWPTGGQGGRRTALDFVLPGLAALGLWLLTGLGVGDKAVAISVVAGALAAGFVMLFAWWGSPLRFALGLGVLIVMMPPLLDKGGVGDLREPNAIYSERSYFGVNRVKKEESPFAAHFLFHGTTVHGAQKIEEGVKTVPRTYYHPAGPLGQVFRAFPFWRFNRVGVVGLGTGATACYGRPGQHWTFYEIDPVVERIARDRRFFTFLSDCAPKTDIVIGDARLSLEAVPDETFDLLILDAFSSDSIPIHLMTAEAFSMYRRKLAPAGVIAAHISNRFLDLEPTIGRLTQETGFFGVIQYHTEGVNEAELNYPSIWVVMARSPDDILELAPDMRWEPLRGAKAELWTDDYVNIIGALRHVSGTE
jgi:hypothetical protein